jgi:phosphomannomutase
MAAVPFNLRIFKAYDIRGIYPTEINREAAELIGRALVGYLQPRQMVVGRDMRLSSDDLFSGLVAGLRAAGAGVVDIGLCSTDALYFAVGKYGYDAGVMITASHNPKEYNGFKICRREAVPLSAGEGLDELRQRIESGDLPLAKKSGELARRNITPAFVDHLLSFIDPQKIKPFKIAIDAGNGMAGMLVPKIFSNLHCQVIPLYFELDGSFPNHPASPLEPENLQDLQKKIRETGADLGAAFDGDADRMFLVDEKAKPLGGDVVTALIAKNLLRKNPGATVLYNLICSRLVPEVITRSGGRAVRTRVGHAFIKPLMKEHNAIFGGEHSGHFYFRDNWYADSGMIALLVCLELLSQETRSLSALVREIDPYYRSGEINSRVADQRSILEKVGKNFSDGLIDQEDGLTLQCPDWWFNLRPSNTEPLLRLNVEANSPELLREKTDLLLTLISS